jgi:hypothetical protein
MKQAGGARTVDLQEAYLSYHSLPPQRKLILMILRLVITDRASHMDFWPWTPKSEDRDLQISFVAGGQTEWLVPVPDGFQVMVLRELKEIAGLSSARRGFACFLRRLANKLDGEKMYTSSSQLSIRWANDQVSAYIAICEDDGGDHIHLRFLDHSEALVERLLAEGTSLFGLAEEPNTVEPSAEA